jgi:hypothetical protein
MSHRCGRGTAAGACSQQAPNICRTKCFVHPLTASLFSPLSPLHYLRDGAPIGIANNANRGAELAAGSWHARASVQHFIGRGDCIYSGPETANSQSQLYYDCDWLASHIQRHGYDLNGQSGGHA